MRERSFNLLLLTVDFPPDVGGVATYLASYLGGYQNGQVQILAPAVRGLPSADMLGQARIERRALESRWLRPRWLPALFRAWQAVRRGRPDLVLVSHLLNMGRVAWLVRRLTGLPYAVIVHGMDVALASRGGRRTRRAAKRVLDGAAVVIANSRFTAGLVNDLTDGRVQAKVVLPPPAMPLDEPVSTEEVGAFRLGHGLAREDFVLLTAARLVHRKGVDVCLRALQELLGRGRKVRLLILGDGPERKTLEDLSRKLHLSDGSAVFLGRIGDRERNLALASCDAFALMSRSVESDLEGFGIVYVEAGVFSKPTIGTRVGGVPEAIAEGETGLLVDENDVGGLVEAVERLMDDPDLSGRLGQGGRLRTEREYGQGRQLRLFEEIVESAVLKENPNE